MPTPSVICAEPPRGDSHEAIRTVHTVRDAVTGGRWLDRAVFALDHWLCRRQGIYEYTNRSDCLFRIQLADVEQRLSLSDGSEFRAGEPMLKLHLWNEHIPPMGQRGASIAWARRMSRAVDRSLRELTYYLGRHPELSHVRVLGGDMRLGNARQRVQFVRIASRYGFESLPLHSPPWWQEVLHRLGDALLILLLVLATNPIALRRSPLRHMPSRVYMSRAALRSRYGFAPARDANAKRRRKLLSVPGIGAPDLRPCASRSVTHARRSGAASAKPPSSGTR